MFTKDSGLAVPSLDPSPYPDLLSSQVIVDKVNALLEEADPFKASGPDGNCWHLVLYYHLTHL